MSKFINVTDYNIVGDDCVGVECPHYHEETDSCDYEVCVYYDYKKTETDEN